MSKDACDERTAREDLHTRHEGICPYFRKEQSGGKVYCEGATLRFPDRQARRDIVYRFCAHPDGYNDCPLKQALDGYYARKYAREDARGTARSGRDGEGGGT